MIHQIFRLIVLLTVTFPFSVYAQETPQNGLPEGAIARLGKGGINVMQFSPDGKYLVVGTDVGVWVYDTKTGDEKGLFADNPAQINALAFSPDGKTLASAGFANMIIQLWDLQTGSKLSKHTFRSKTEVISGLAFSQDGSRVIFSKKYGSIRHWDLNSKKIVFKSDNLMNHEAITFSKVLNVFALGKQDGEISFYDASTGTPKEGLKGFTSLFKTDDSDIWTLAFSQDGSLLASGGIDKIVRLWDTKSRRLKASFSGDGNYITTVAISHDGSMLVSGDAHKRIIIWNTQTRKKRGELVGHTNGICSLVFSPDGTILASGSYDGTIRFWDPIKETEISIFTDGHIKWITSLAFTEDDNTLISTDYRGTVYQWDMISKQGTPLLEIGKDRIVTTASQSKDTALYASNGNSTPIAFSPLGLDIKEDEKVTSFSLWNVSTNERIPGPWEQLSRINALALSPDNNHIIVSDTNKGILSWNIDSAEENILLNYSTTGKGKFTFSPNGRMMAFNARRYSTIIWNMDTNVEITPKDLRNDATSLTFSPDNTQLAVVYNDKIVLWDIESEKITERGSIKVNFIRDVIYSPDGKYLITPYKPELQFLVKVWDVETGSSLLTLNAHTEKINTIRFSHNGLILATGSMDGSILLWDWEKIKKRLIIKRVKNLTGHILPPVSRKQFDSKEEEAEAVKSWFENRGYRLVITPDSFSLINGLERESISLKIGERINKWNLEIRINDGYFTIDVYKVGTGTFILEEGVLIYHEIEDRN
ncbi:WD40 repeat domain-containing protein [Candidatus Poribacteria bacterium]|nr:WD40 repeat domain-containing protein [Candidatus Poribacteria bacterium]